jgi:hypothetical protein
MILISGIKLLILSLIIPKFEEAKMGAKKSPGGGINISGDRISIKGDIIGRDKITKNYGMSAEDLSKLAKEFQFIRNQVNGKIADETKKGKIDNSLTKIEKEIKKGQEADPTKIEKWLQFIAGMSDDIYQVVLSTLSNPVLGISKAVQLIIQKARNPQKPGS